ATTDQLVQDSHGAGGPVRFRLRRGPSGPLEGLLQGLLGARAGETRRIRVPSAMAYGAVGRPPEIPSHADLVFDVEVLEVR
ncbi:MAG: FKBP-type peptidyl-prolyl cis-trans isomerase, partial [Planctomycetota bacterium]